MGEAEGAGPPDDGAEADRPVEGAAPPPSAPPPVDPSLGPVPTDLGTNGAAMNDPGTNDPGTNGPGMNRAGMNDPGSNGAGTNGAGSVERSPWSAPLWSSEPDAGRALTGVGPSTAAPLPAAGVLPLSGTSVVQAPSGSGPGSGPTGAGPQRARPSPPHRPSGDAAPPTAAAPPAHRWGLGAYLLAEAVFVAASVLVYLVAISGRPPSAGALALGIAAPSLLAAGTALLITQVRGNGPRIDLRLEWSWRDVGIGLAFGLGGLVVTIPAAVLYLELLGENVSTSVNEAFDGVTAAPPLALLVLLVVVVVAPTCEEILYRGLLWGGVERLGGPRVAFAVTTLLFALAHFEFTRTPLLLLVALPIAAARLYTGRLLASIVAHQVNNLLPGIALLLAMLGMAPQV